MALVCGTGRAEAADARFRFSIPPRAYADALIDLGLQANVSVLGTASCGPGGRAALTGRYTLDQALQRLLSGAPCRYTVVDARTIRILPAAPPPQASPSRDARRVTLDQGQAVFDVAHAPRRPFTTAAGDRTVRVVGTQFDVRRLGGKLSVTVARGAVEVRPAEGAAGRAFRLHPGQRLDHQEGAAVARIAPAEAEEVLGWRRGRLVYREQPLSDVVADLNQQFATPIRIEDPALASTPISGVLVLDDQSAVIQRLALLVPIRAVRSHAGVVLRRDVASDR